MAYGDWKLMSHHITKGYYQKDSHPYKGHLLITDTLIGPHGVHRGSTIVHACLRHCMATCIYGWSLCPDTILFDWPHVCGGHLTDD